MLRYEALELIIDAAYTSTSTKSEASFFFSFTINFDTSTGVLALLLFNYLPNTLNFRLLIHSIKEQVVSLTDPDT